MSEWWVASCDFLLYFATECVSASVVSECMPMSLPVNWAQVTESERPVDQACSFPLTCWVCHWSIHTHTHSLSLTDRATDWHLHTQTQVYREKKILPLTHIAERRKRARARKNNQRERDTSQWIQPSQQTSSWRIKRVTSHLLVCITDCGEKRHFFCFFSRAHPRRSYTLWTWNISLEIILNFSLSRSPLIWTNVLPTLLLPMVSHCYFTLDFFTFATWFMLAIVPLLSASLCSPVHVMQLALFGMFKSSASLQFDG